MVTDCLRLSARNNIIVCILWMILLVIPFVLSYSSIDGIFTLVLFKFLVGAIIYFATKRTLDEFYSTRNFTKLKNYEALLKYGEVEDIIYKLDCDYADRNFYISSLKTESKRNLHRLTVFKDFIVCNSALKVHIVPIENIIWSFGNSTTIFVYCKKREDSFQYNIDKKSIHTVLDILDKQFCVNTKYDETLVKLAKSEKKYPHLISLCESIKQQRLEL